MTTTATAGASAPAAGLTGPEHFTTGQQLLANGVRHITEDPQDMRIAEVCIAAAQVHFLAAQTAVHAAILADRYIGDGDHINDWRNATNPQGDTQ
jgi:hypothetical protein